MRNISYLTVEEQKEITRSLVNAINCFGVKHQFGMIQEECAELIAALSQYQRKKIGADEVIDEIADVMIVALQAALIFGYEKCNKRFWEKLNRLDENVTTKESTHCVLTHQILEN